MDKRTKKRMTVLQERLKKFQQILAGARQQCDDPAEITEMEEQIKKIKKELLLLADAG